MRCEIEQLIAASLKSEINNRKIENDDKRAQKINSLSRPLDL